MSFTWDPLGTVMVSAQLNTPYLGPLCARPQNQFWGVMVSKLRASRLLVETPPRQVTSTLREARVYVAHRARSREPDL